MALDLFTLLSTYIFIEIGNFHVVQWLVVELLKKTDDVSYHEMI